VENYSVGEDFQAMHVLTHIAVVLTNHRALAFSAFTGGFFAQDLSTDEPVLDTTINDNVVILSTVSRRLIFRAQVPLWSELR
jgi:hypothetical protein